MKKTFDFFKIIGISVAVGLAILFLSRNDHFSCSAIDAFSNKSSFSLLFKAFKLLSIAIGVWIAGLIAFLIIRQKKKINIYIYFTLITTLSLSPVILIVINRHPEENRQIKEHICSKGTDDGMQLSFQKLTKDEYHFINAETNWLPELPGQTKYINIDYYRDDFIGDFHLKIEIELIENGTIDSIRFPKWKNSDNRYYYEDYQD